MGVAQTPYRWARSAAAAARLRSWLRARLDDDFASLRMAICLCGHRRRHREPASGGAADGSVLDRQRAATARPRRRAERGRGTGAPTCSAAQCCGDFQRWPVHGNRARQSACICRRSSQPLPPVRRPRRAHGGRLPVPPKAGHTMSAAVEIGATGRDSLHSEREPACAHCNLPVSAAKIDLAREEQFCCDGCRSVFAILHSAGLEDYYTQRDPDNRQTFAAQYGQRRFEELDEPAFRESHCRDRGDGVLRCEFFVEGVHCSACVWLLERLPRVAPAVLEARYDLTRSVLQVTWDPASAPLSEVGRALDSLGFTPHPTHSTNLAAEQRKGDRALLLRLGIAGAAAGNVMLMALALYSGKYAGMAAEYTALFRWGSLAIATPAVFWAGNLFFRGGLAALRTRTPHMDLPVSLGLLAGYLGSAWSTLRGQGEIYFDSLCTLIFLLLVGRYLQRTHQRRSAKASDLINALAPTTARLVEGEVLREVPANTVAVGSTVEIRAGERVSVDGVISDGRSEADASLLTGESFPIEVTVGDRIHAGTTNLSAPLRVRVESVGGETRLGRLMQSVEATQ